MKSEWDGLRQGRNHGIAIFVAICYVSFSALSIYLTLHGKHQFIEIKTNDLPKPFNAFFSALLSEATTFQPLDANILYNVVLDVHNPLSPTQRRGCWQTLQRQNARLMGVCHGAVTNIHLSSYAASTMAVKVNQNWTLELRFPGEADPLLSRFKVGDAVTCTGFFKAQPEDGLFDCKIE